MTEDDSPKTARWTRRVIPGAWNEVEYKSPSGRWLVRRVMMASSRNGCWRAEWHLTDSTRPEARGSYYDTLSDAKTMTGEG